MFKRLLGIAFMSVYSRFFQTKVRRGSLRAVRGYLRAVEFMRLGLIGIAALGATVAVFVSGLVLSIMGILALIPMGPRTMALAVFGIGVLFVAASAVILALAFSQRRWLQLSKSYELMDAVLSPWPNALPPNPVDVLKGHERVARRESESEFEDVTKARELIDTAVPTPT